MTKCIGVVFAGDEVINDGFSRIEEKSCLRSSIQIVLVHSDLSPCISSLLTVYLFPFVSPQIMAALAVSLGPFAVGLGKGYSSPAIDSLQMQHHRFPHHGNSTSTSFTVSDQQASWVASLSLLGALFGGMFGGLAMRYGRKRVLLLTSLPFSVSWVITVFANSVEMMFATAFIGGFCCAIVLLVTQVTLLLLSSVTS